LGERVYEKRSSILAEVLMVLEIELWAVDPSYPRPKDETTQQDPWLPLRVAAQN
jgi:hypothetical protein